VPNSSRGRNSGRNGMLGRAGTVTVIEEPVMRNYARMAKVAFWVVSLIAGLLAMLILSAVLSALAAVVAAVVIGPVIGAAAWAFVIVWPVLRAIWWWLPEITVTAGLAAGWLELASCTGLIVRITVVVLVLGVPAAIGPVRRRITALGWCLVSRHRIRTCFSEFIITNRYGTLPLILWARPTPAGERLWIWLRPGRADRDRLLGIQRHHRPGRPVQLRAAADRHQAARPADRRHRLPAQGRRRRVHPGQHARYPGGPDGP
jgi:hypothetical protein